MICDLQIIYQIPENNCNLQIMSQLYGDEYILPYNIQEMNIVLRYLSGDNYLTIDVLKKKSRDKTYLEIWIKQHTTVI